MLSLFSFGHFPFFCTQYISSTLLFAFTITLWSAIHQGKCWGSSRPSDVVGRVAIDGRASSLWWLSSEGFGDVETWYCGGRLRRGTKGETNGVPKRRDAEGQNYVNNPTPRRYGESAKVVDDPPRNACLLLERKFFLTKFWNSPKKMSIVDIFPRWNKLLANVSNEKI